MLNETKLVWDLQRANQIAQDFSNALDLEEITHLATAGLVQYFDCAFARIWLVESDRKQLRLIASSGLYTQINGSFSRIPMGEFKIGRIAQNRVSLLSNNLAEESWIQHPEWAIAHKINSFAGYPLANSDKVIGVLAVFGHNPLRSEFLEVLLSLCTTLTVALEMALLHQQEKQIFQKTQPKTTLAEWSLSDSLAHVLDQTKLTVIGTERHLDFSQTQVFLKVAEILKTLECTYCRLTYEVDAISFEAIAAISAETTQETPVCEHSLFGTVSAIAACFGGILKVNTEASIKAIQVSLTFPASVSLLGLSVSIQCSQTLLQTGLTQLAYSAGLTVQASGDRQVPLLTDQVSLLTTSDRIIWVNQTAKKTPNEVKAQIDLSTTPNQLREAVETVMRGDTWGLTQDTQAHPKLSHREQEVMTLLVKGLRDREVADQLYISDSTVKFHINNILTKLGAKTRLQALYMLMNTDGLSRSV
ncbi:MAG: GAF domain-containing protein [Leptolyngbya sp. SIO1D8]|nr:GAF domain-containing protein [Leptolyngbya sp. SIO1D8]